MENLSIPFEEITKNFSKNTASIYTYSKLLNYPEKLERADARGVHSTKK